MMSFVCFYPVCKVKTLWCLHGDDREDDEDDGDGWLDPGQRPLLLDDANIRFSFVGPFDPVDPG